MNRLIFASFILLPTLAWSQVLLSWGDQASTTGTQTLNVTKSVGPSSCGGSESVRWQVQNTVACSDFKVWITTGTSCTDRIGDNDYEVTSVTALSLPLTRSRTDSFQISNLPIFADEDNKRCADFKDEKTLTVCASVEIPGGFGVCGTSGSLFAKASTPLVLNFDGKAPKAPLLNSVDPLDSELGVSFSVSDDTSTLVFEVRLDSTGELISTQEAVVSGSSYTLKNLTNNEKYSITAYAKDLAGNQSASSNALTGSPIRTTGFWSAYVDAGGQEPGGCNSANGAILGLVSLLPLLVLRRRRAVAQIAVLSIVLAASSSAQAQSNPQAESRKSGLIEVKLGNVTPMIDSEAALGDAKPFQSTFGKSPLLLAELEYDQQLFQSFGSLALGFSIGYAEIFGKGVVAGTTEKTSQAVSFMLLPMKLMAIYRFDYPALKWGIPLVPYGKFGLAYTAWWANKGSSNESATNGVKGVGGTWGYVGVGGLSFMLDVLDRRLARDFDVDFGVNHTYLFAEYVYEDVNDFGAKSLNLSSRHWMFGLGFEF